MNKTYIQFVQLKTNEVIQAFTNYPNYEPHRDSITGEILFKNETFQCHWQDVKNIRTIKNDKYNPSVED